MTGVGGPIAERTVRLGQTSLHYATAGAGKPLVLLHGWPASSFLWRGVIPPLAERARVLAPDLAGFGRSDKPDVESYSLDFHAKKLGDFLDAVGAGKPALVLHDLGAPVGLLWAVRNPGRVERLVVLNTLIYPDGPAARLFWAAGSLRQRAKAILDVERVPLAVKLMLLAAHIPGLRRLVFHRHLVAQVMRMGVARRLEGGIATAYGRPFATPDGRRALRRTFLDPRLVELEEIVGQLGSLRVPALVAFGERDRLLPGVAGEMRRLARDLPGARLATLPRCGHFLQEDDPEEVARLVTQFLGDWVRA